MIKGKNDARFEPKTQKSEAVAFTYWHSRLDTGFDKKRKCKGQAYSQFLF